MAEVAEADDTGALAAYWLLVGGVELLKAFPAQMTLHDSVLNDFGTCSQTRRSCPSTGKPSTVALPWSTTFWRSVAACWLIEKAWIWRITWMKQWTIAKAK
jgi:hypothetical protein